jgi:hypothetical protein
MYQLSYKTIRNLPWLSWNRLPILTLSLIEYK